MLIRTVLIFSLHIFNAIANQNDTATDSKPKRGIYQISDGSDYSVIPLHHIGRLPQVRALSDASQVDITYKPNEEYQQNQYDAPDAIKLSSNNNNNYKINEQTYSAQQHIPQYAQQHYHQLNIPQNPRLNSELSQIQQLPQLQQQTTIPNHYPINLHPRVSAHLPIYGADKQHIKLPDYTESYGGIPIIYGQSNGNLPSLKYIQPYPAKTQYNPTQYLQQFKPQKYPAQNLQMRQFNPLYKSQFYQPQVFDNPIVPQIQHYLPQIQSPFDAFTKPVTSAPLIYTTKPPPKKQEQSKSTDDDDDDDDEDDDDDDEKHHRKEEIKAEVIRHESNDEDDFDHGYEEAARDFPAYKRDDDDDDDDHPRSKYEKYRSRYADDDEYRSRRPHDYDDDRRSRYVDRDPEGHYSQKHAKKESKAPKSESKKRVRTEAEVRHKSSGKYQTKSSPKKTYYSSSKKSASKNPREAASSKSEIEFKPSYQYGFEPMKTLSKHADSIAKSSSPISTKKIYKENWYISKTSNI